MSIQHDMQARQLADRAQLLFDAGMLSDAAFAAEQSLEFDGDNLITRVLLARIELARGRGKQALLALDHHARCAPDQLQSPEMLLMRAQAYVQAGLDRDAQAVLEGLMQNYPDDCRAYRLAVGMHLRGGRTHHAANLLRDLARTQPNDQAVRRTLASLIADDTPDEAIELLAASVGSGDDAIVQLSLARAYVRDERYADAEPMYADLLAEKPHDSRLRARAQPRRYAAPVLAQATTQARPRGVSAAGCCARREGCGRVIDSARARGYRLLSRLFIRGPSEIRRRDLQAIGGEPPSIEALETSFVAAFDLGVPPYASTFLAPDGRTGTEVTREITESTLPPLVDAPFDVAPCHLGALLAQLAALTSCGRSEAAAQMSGASLLTWLPALIAAVERLRLPFWSSALLTTVDLVASEARGVPVRDTALGPMPANPLDNPSTGLREVAEHLSHPARSGFFLSEAECASLGRSLDLPRGFGSRRQRIETLLRSGAEYSALPQLCQSLGEIARHRATRLGELAADRYDPGFNRGWLARISQTQAMLATLEQGATSLRRSG